MTMETVVTRKKTAHTIELRRMPRPGGSALAENVLTLAAHLG